MKDVNVNLTELIENKIDYELLNEQIPLPREQITEIIANHLQKLNDNSEAKKILLGEIPTILDFIDYLIGINNVRDYCNIDAESCILLFNKLFMYFNAAEMATLANISMDDAYWKADGMKVTNFICKYAHRRNFIIDLITIEAGEDAKYPGAYVVWPKSGQYKFKPFLFYKRNMETLSELDRIFLAKDIINNTKESESETKLRESDNNIKESDNNDAHESAKRFVEEDSVEAREKIKQRIIANLNKFGRYLSRRNKKRINDIIAAIQQLDVSSETAESVEKILAVIIELNALGFPIVALDFSSLYPNIIRTYNLSPETIIRNKVKAEKYKALGWKLHEISFKYGSRDVLAWSLLWDPQGNRIKCIYGEILGDLFDLRNKVKEDLKKYPLESMKNKGLMGTPEYTAAEFMYKCIDSKQKAIKVIMNTLYGKAGHKASPLFMAEISGGTTTMGQINLKLIDKFITEEEDIKVRYGDTDSLYQQFAFTAYQKEYEEFIEYFEEQLDRMNNGEITAEENKKLIHIKLLDYCTKMVKITQNKMPELSKRVGAYLKSINGMEYLQMAYEEVLYSTYLIIKKKYGGIPHIKDVSFENYGDGFVKGMLSVKAGYSKFAKDIIKGIIKQLNDIYDEASPLEIVKATLDKIFTTQWSIDDFIATTAYKPNKLEGNKKVKTFIERMRLEGYDDPLPYSRFPSIIVKKYPFGFDRKGRKYHLKVGDKMEYPHVAKAKGYEIDIFHYVGQSLLAELAAIITMEPEFRIRPTSNDEAAIKIAYKESLKMAKKYLKDFIDQYMVKYTTNQGSVFKYLYREIYKNYVVEMSSKFETLNLRDFNIVFNLDYMAKADIFGAWLKNIDKIAKERAKKAAKKYLTNIKADYALKSREECMETRDQIAKIITGKKDMYDSYLRWHEPDIKKIENHLNELKDKYITLYKVYNVKMEREIMSIRDSLDIEKDNGETKFDENFYTMLVNKIRSVNIDINIDKDDISIINELLDLNQKLILYKAMLYDTEITIDELKAWSSIL